MRFPPLLNDRSRRLIHDEAPFITELVNAFGGFCHVLTPESFRDNAREIGAAFTGHGVRGHICYATKVNASDVFLEESARSGLGIDVSSLNELRASLAHGIPGESVCVSGPIKERRFIELSVRVNALLSVDSREELDKISNLSRSLQLGHPARILLRIDGSPNSRSRLGMAESDISEALAFLRLEGGETVSFQGIHFHIYTESIEDRADTILSILDRLKQCNASGFQAGTINIGGGFPVSYLDEPCWDAFQRLTRAERASLYHEGRQPPEYYPHWHPAAGGAYLSKLLSSTDRDGETIAAKLRNSGYRLVVEPGRALLDQCGFSCFAVRGLKVCPERGGSVTVAGNSYSLCSQKFRLDFLVDPVLLPHRPPGVARAGREAPFLAHVTGSTNSQTDAFSWRKIEFDRVPQEGDVLVYPNTAAYEMDFIETPIHRQDRPKKVVITDGLGARPNWCSESAY